MQKIKNKTCTKCYKEKEIIEFNMSRNVCKMCRFLYKKKWDEENKALKYTSNNKWRKNNIDKVLQSNAKWIKDNKYRHNEWKTKYQIENAHKYNARSAKRRAYKLNATFVGYDEILKTFYTRAKELEKQDGVPRDVHHIIPLQEFLSTVCGLHVPWNLEILTEKEHIGKHVELRKKYKK